MTRLIVKQPSAGQSLWELLRNSGGVFESSIKGVSMEPTMPEGALVRIQPLPADDYKKGHIVVCELDDVLFAHRIVHCASAGRRKDFVVTRGDGHLMCDPPTRKTKIVGMITQFQDGGTWRAPGPLHIRGPGIQAMCALHQSAIWACLLIHYEFARRVAGTSLILANFLRRMIHMTRHR